MVGIKQIPQKWGKMLREYCSGGNGSCRDHVGMELVFAGTLQGCFTNLADDKNLGVSIRIVGIAT